MVLGWHRCQGWSWGAGARRDGGARGLYVSECIIWGAGELTSHWGASQSNVCIIKREVHWPGCVRVCVCVCVCVSVVGWGTWWHCGTYGCAARRVMVLGWRRCRGWSWGAGVRRAGGVRGLCVSECIWGMGGLTSRRGASRSNVCIVEREVHWPGGGCQWWDGGCGGTAGRTDVRRGASWCWGGAGARLVLGSWGAWGLYVSEYIWGVGELTRRLGTCAATVWAVGLARRRSWSIAVSRSLVTWRLQRGSPVATWVQRERTRWCPPSESRAGDVAAIGVVRWRRRSQNLGRMLVGCRATSACNIPRFK